MEAATKKKRGRPATISESSRAFIRSTFSETTSRKGQDDIFYRVEAISIIQGSGDDTLRWLADPEKMKAGGRGGWKPSILTELGRIGDEDELLTVARQLSALSPRPTSKVCVAMIRQYRIGRTKPDPLSLANQIIATVNRYLSSHPDMTAEQIGDAMRTATAQIDALTD